MRLLLDTHIWIWSLQDPGRLGKRVQRELADPQNERWLSPISTWEALTLHVRRRVILLPNLPEWVEGAIATSFVRGSVHPSKSLLAARQTPLPHQDPADRFLVATAKVLGLTLVTADKTLLGLSENLHAA